MKLPALKVSHNTRLKCITPRESSNENSLFYYRNSWKSLVVVIHPFFPLLSLNIFSWAGVRRLRHTVSLMRMFVWLWVS